VCLWLLLFSELWSDLLLWWVAMYSFLNLWLWIDLEMFFLMNLFCFAHVHVFFYSRDWRIDLFVWESWGIPYHEMLVMDFDPNFMLSCFSLLNDAFLGFEMEVNVICTDC
jgi:hypothetical protein